MQDCSVHSQSPSLSLLTLDIHAYVRVRKDPFHVLYPVVIQSNIFMVNVTSEQLFSVSYDFYGSFGTFLIINDGKCNNVQGILGKRFTFQHTHLKLNSLIIIITTH